MTSGNTNKHKQVLMWIFFLASLLGFFLCLRNHDPKYLIYPPLLVIFAFIFTYVKNYGELVEKEHPLVAMATLGIFFPASIVFVFDIVGYLLDGKIYYPIEYLLGAIGLGFILVMIEKLRIPRLFLKK